MSEYTPKPIVNIRLGGKPVPGSAIARAKDQHMTAKGWPAEMREDALVQLMSDPTSSAAQKAMSALGGFRLDLIETYKINTFNHRLHAYRAATARLAKHRLADGREEVVEPQEVTHLYPDAVEAVFEDVVTRSAIPPLPPTVTVDMYEDGEVVGTEEVPNPAIVIDDAERARAQEVIDSTPLAVKEFGE